MIGLLRHRSKFSDARTSHSAGEERNSLFFVFCVCFCYLSVTRLNGRVCQRRIAIKAVECRDEFV